MARTPCAPGGFSYGDYLRTGALARHSPVMEEVARFAARGGPVLGICNGFQILLEAGVLPGAMVRNRGLKFVCRDVHLRREGSPPGSPAEFPSGCASGGACRRQLRRGSDDARAAGIRGPRGLPLLRCGRTITDGCANPNGSANNIAGISNEAGNVVGLTPHPERASEAILGSADGRTLFDAVLANA